MTKHEDPANANAQPQRPPSNCTREQPATPTINPPPHRRLAKTTSTDLRHLLHHRNDIKLTHDGLSLALIDASRADHERDAKILLEAGADVNYTGCEGGLVLLVAARRGHGGLVRILPEEGARVEEVHLYGVI
ncbi:uncharacterized protein RCO7_11070 [Rhynchosporium graminicola]|uniref:Uncharacterized protein n=1 Tax=Rhynchosporium graminicola TaxID=2792576 RepID=A0A1E1KVF2_9HELO|nr:uncharacterized protein RCO7_11070 [Rhynchosporium commune]